MLKITFEQSLYLRNSWDFCTNERECRSKKKKEGAIKIKCLLQFLNLIAFFH